MRKQHNALKNPSRHNLNAGLKLSHSSSLQNISPLGGDSFTKSWIQISVHSFQILAVFEFLKIIFCTNLKNAKHTDRWGPITLLMVPLSLKSVENWPNKRESYRRSSSPYIFWLAKVVGLRPTLCLGWWACGPTLVFDKIIISNFC